MTKRHWIVVGIALTVAVVGIAIGSMVDVQASGVNCGPPWGDGPVIRGLGIAEQCAEASASSNTTAWVLTIGGLAVALVVGIVGYLSQRKDVDA